MTDMKQALETIQRIYQMLEDEESKDIYMYRLASYVSGDRKYMFDMVNTYMRRCPDGAHNYHLFLPKDRRFVLYGAGKDGAMLLPHVMSLKNFAGFCSSTLWKQEKGYMGFPVMSPEELLSQKDLAVVITTTNFRNDIMRILKDGEYPPELIIDGPRFYSDHFSEAEQYYGPSFMKFQDEEIFVDAGCYDLGSSLNLAAHCKCAKVYAFEPDPENYKKCLRNAERREQGRIQDVQIFPYGVWSEHTTLHFYADGTGGSTFCGNTAGGISVPVTTIDRTVDPHDRVTMIKMDVEGSELEALKGARETILRDKPKLAICIYHKLEDLWEIPLYIKELVPEYRLWIRHHSSCMFETVLYAVMPE